MDLHLGGHLAFFDVQKRSRVAVPLGVETALVDVIRGLGIPEAEIGLAAVNREIVRLGEARVSDGDRVDLYPPMDGGSLPA